MARELTIKITADGAQAKREMESVEKGISGVTDQTAKAEQATKHFGAAVAAAFAALKINESIRQSLELTSRIQDLSDRLGISAEAVQKLDFALKQSGSSIDTAAAAIGIMSRHLTDGDKGAVEALTTLGLRLDDLRGKKPDEAFVSIAEAIRKVPDPITQSALALELFGRGALPMLPAIKNGIKEVGDQAPIMSGAVVKAGDEAGDKILALNQRMDNLRAQGLLPLVEWFTTHVPESVQVAGVALFDLTPSLEQVLLGVLALGGPKAALAAMTGALTTVGSTLVGLGGTLVTFATGAGAALVTFFTTTLPAAFAAVIAFLGPQGLIALAVIALGLIWYKWGDDITRIVKQVYGAIKEWLVDRFNAVVESIKKKVDAVSGFFKDMYEKVVGHSFVPDMVRRIGQEFAKLDQVMVSPAAAAAGGVESIFANLSTKVGGIVGGMLKGIGGQVGGFLKGVVPNLLGSLSSALSGGISGAVSGLVSGAVTAIGNHLKGGEEGMYVNPRRDAFSAQFGGPGFDEGSAYVNLGNMLNSLGRGDLLQSLASADKVDKFTGIEQVIVDLLERSGFGNFRVFDTGGMVPGWGHTPAILQGGEGVLSRRGMAALDQLNSGGSGGWAAVADRLDRLERTLDRTLARSVGRAVGDELGKLRTRTV